MSFSNEEGQPPKPLAAMAPGAGSGSGALLPGPWGACVHSMHASMQASLLWPPSRLGVLVRHAGPLCGACWAAKVVVDDIGCAGHPHTCMSPSQRPAQTPAPQRHTRPGELALSCLSRCAGSCTAGTGRCEALSPLCACGLSPELLFEFLSVMRFDEGHLTAVYASGDASRAVQSALMLCHALAGCNGRLMGLGHPDCDARR